MSRRPLAGKSACANFTTNVYARAPQQLPALAGASREAPREKSLSRRIKYYL
jgi:hypothetical protein